MVGADKKLFVRKFLWDRPELHKDLRKLLLEMARR